LVGKPISNAPLLAKRAVALLPYAFHSHARLSEIVFERKTPLVPISKHIDTVSVFDPQKTTMLKMGELHSIQSANGRKEDHSDDGKITADDLKPSDSGLKNPEITSLPDQKRTFRDKVKARVKGKIRTVLFGGIIIFCLAILTYLFLPTIYYTIFPGDSIPIETDASGTPLGGNFSSGSARVSSTVATPAYDANLPDGNWLIIPKIGVKTEILESATPDESLNKGVWRVPDFGTVTDLSKPMILAAHRYGWKAWWENGNQYWRYHSFYLLPKLEQGDIIEVISDHRKYIYEVYAGEQGEEISDYNADLILYTCKFLDSPLRYFRYARLVDPNNPAAISSK